MRILTIVTDLGPGGTQRTAQNLTAGYVAAGHEAAVYGYQGGGPREAPLRDLGVQLFVGAADQAADGSAFADALGWRPDVVHLHRHGSADPETGAMLRRIATELPDATVLETSHFSRVDRSADRAFIDVHLQLSEWCLWKWEQWSRGLTPSPVGAVVPNPVDLTAFFPAPPDAVAAFRKDLGLGDDDVLLGRIGQPIQWKWMPLVVESFARLAERDPNVHLLLVGRPPSLTPAIEALPPDVRARLHEITFLHGDDALRTAYTAIDVFVHAAEIGESFGLVLTESMLCETPVVTLSRPARDNSQLEVVGHEHGGLVASTPAAFDAATRRLIDDPALRRRLGMDGADATRRRFALETVMETLLRILDHAQAAPDRESLRRALRADPAVVTHVPDAKIEQRLAASEGRIPLKERVAMRLVHHPGVYALWRAVKFGPLSRSSKD